MLPGWQSSIGGPAPQAGIPLERALLWDKGICRISGQMQAGRAREPARLDGTEYPLGTDLLGFRYLSSTIFRDTIFPGVDSL